jgi:hypothetical protein
MTKNNHAITGAESPAIFQIRVRGHLDQRWTDWFEGLTITQDEDGNTSLTGAVIDQAALFGLIKKIRDLGMQLISINRLDGTGD